MAPCCAWADRTCPPYGGSALPCLPGAHPALLTAFAPLLPTDPCLACSQPSVSYKTNAVKTTARGYRCIDFHDGGRIEIHFPSYYLRGAPRRLCGGCAQGPGVALTCWWGAPAAVQELLQLHPLPCHAALPPCMLPHPLHPSWRLPHCAGLLYTSAPRGEVAGTAEFVDAKNGLEAVVRFGQVEDAPPGSVLQRPDAVSGSIYRTLLLQTADSSDAAAGSKGLDRQPSTDSNGSWVMPASAEKVGGLT